jgi:hypothetical protein
MPLGMMMGMGHSFGMAGQPETMAEWVARWQRLGPVLEQERHATIRTSDMSNIRALMPTADLLRRVGGGERAECGLVEQQAWFQKLRHG